MTEQIPPPSADRLPIATSNQTRRELGLVMRGRWGALWLSVVLLMLSAAAGLVAPAALGAMVDVIGDTDAGGQVIWYGVLMAVGAIAEGVLLAVGVVLASRLAERLLAMIRERMVARAFARPQNTVERAGAGDLTSRATDDVAMISEVVPSAVLAVGGAAFTIFTTLIGMAVLDWRFALAMLVVVPTHVLTIRWYLRTAPEVYRAERAANAEKASRMLGAFRGLETVRAFGLTDRERASIARASWEVARWSLWARIVQNRFFGRLNFAEFVGMASILVTSFYLVRADAVTVGMATTATLFFMRLFDPINQLLFVIDEMQSALASLNRIVGVEQAEPSRSSSLSTRPSSLGLLRTGSEGRQRRTSVETLVAALHDVTFGYDGANPVVRDVSRPRPHRTRS